MPNPTLTSARQIVDRDTLQQVFPNVPGQLLDLLLRSIDKDLTVPLRVDASSTPNLVVTIGPSVVNNTISGRQKSINAINSAIPAFTSGTITFPSANSGTIVVSPGSNITLSCPSNQYVKILVSLDSTGNLVASQGASNAVEANAAVPFPVTNTLPVCYISLFNNAGTIQNVAQNKIFQFIGSGGSTGGGGGGTVPTGGTGLSSLSPYDILLGGATSTSPMQQVSGEGTAGQVLTSNGSSAIPSWQNSSSLSTQSINSNTTAVNGKCYLVDTSSPVTINLPSPVNNFFFRVKDAIGNAATNNITIHRFASELIDGMAVDLIMDLGFESIAIISDGTNWFILDEYQETFLTATGGTITTNGNYKIHTFTSSGTFQVTSGTGLVDSLIVAGGASGGANGNGGGGGAGGLLFSSNTMSPGSYPVVVGAGGAANSSSGSLGNNGLNSTFNALTAIGGGTSDVNPSGKVNISDGRAGGSGGGGYGAGGTSNGGSGTIGQGNTGGSGDGGTNGGGGGGGGAGAIGTNASSTNGGAGGNGLSNSISGSPVTYAGGGGGAGGIGGTAGSGGSGGGGAGGASIPGSNGSANTGGGGGGTGNSGGSPGGAGGSGIVIIRYRFQ